MFGIRERRSAEAPLLVNLAGATFEPGSLRSGCNEGEVTQMGKHDDKTGDRSRQDDRGARPPHGQGHQPLPGETPPLPGETPPQSGEDRPSRKVQNADLPPGEGHQPLPGENPQERPPKP
ncbi:hypothetical protein [Lysobacter sp. 1R34A]|uniref:hypothetical protein n=1 Tax=Lysobacter sp. 1R34A TaxID=3445786 RepID=UPI003EE8F3B0